ncbi:MAG: hypothetical protein IK072_01945 [Clostridia bacterium]|nr:hypothetical protein [Clostridia bacterium]
MSSYIKIEDLELPSPKRGVKPTVATVVNEGRNANATIVGQKIGRDQFKIDELEWPWLSASQWSTILKKLSKFVVDVTFTNPVTNKKITIEMYCGNRTAEPYYLDDSTAKPTYYRNCKVNLIDMGRPIKWSEG